MQTCPNADSTRSQRGGVIKIVIIISNQFDSNFLKRAATLHISLRTKQKMGKRQKERQKDKDENTVAEYSLNRVSEKSMAFDSNTTIFDKSLVFDSNTTYFEKSMVFDPNTTDFEKSMVFGSHTTDFGQIPQILSG